MSSFLLIRHATNDSVNRYIAGRTPGVHLNAEGRDQAERLAESLRDVRIDRILCSPLERTRETAQAIARCKHVDVEIADELIEVDCGEWTGKTFDELARDPRWQRFNTHRAETPVPGGETMQQVQARAIALIQRLTATHPASCIALVSHGDVLRAVVAHSLGAPIDSMLRFELDPASISELDTWSDGAKIRSLNRTVPNTIR